MATNTTDSDRNHAAPADAQPPAAPITTKANARTQVLCLPELFRGIPTHLPLHDVLRSRRVCSRRKGVFADLLSDEPAQRLFLKPITSFRKLVVKRHLLTTNVTPRLADEKALVTHLPFLQEVYPIVVLNRLFWYELLDDLSYASFMFYYQLWDIFRPDTGPLQNMFLTQPPCDEDTFTLTAEGGFKIKDLREAAERWLANNRQDLESEDTDMMSVRVQAEVNGYVEERLSSICKLTGERSWLDDKLENSEQCGEDDQPTLPTVSQQRREFPYGITVAYRSG